MWVELVRSAGGEQLYRQRRSSTLASDDGQSDSASSTPQRLGQLSMAASVSADATSRIDFDERGADDGAKADDERGMESQFRAAFSRDGGEQGEAELNPRAEAMLERLLEGGKL